MEVDLATGSVRASDNVESVTGFAIASGSRPDLRAAADDALSRVVEADRSRLRAAFQALWQDGSTATLRFAVRGDDGIERSIEAVVSVLAVDGRPRKVIATVLDTSAGRRAEATLRESEARYRSALKAGRMGSWETDLRAGTRTWSNEGMALFGIDLPGGRGTVGGDSDEYQAAMHPDDRHLARRFHALADEVDSFPAEYRIVRPDGTQLWLSGRGLVAARTPDGKAHRLISIMSDVTERRHAEEALRKERERLSLALSAGQMGAFDLDIREDVLWWSPQTYAVFGLTPETFTPTRESVAALVHPDDRAMFLRRRAEAIAQHEPLELEFRILRPDGESAWVSHRGQVEYDSTGRPVRSFGITMDITERKRAEQALRDADRKKDDFIATLAHELRNPLAPIRNAVELLRRTGSAPTRSVTWCRDVIDRQVAHMARLLDDLLDVSRITRGKFQLRTRAAAAARRSSSAAIEIAQPLDRRGRPRADGRRCRREPVGLEGDLTRLAQVVSNLLNNAAKYTAGGGRIRLAAAARGRRRRDHACRTTASASPSDSSPRIFDMFGQVEPRARPLAGRPRHRPVAGEGPGRAARRPDRGAQRRARPGQRVRRAPAARSSAGRVAGGGRGRRGTGGRTAVGIACWSPTTCTRSPTAWRCCFELMGHTVARSPTTARRRCARLDEFRPDVALLDLGMPKLNGYDACRRIRSTAWGRQMTLIAQTGWGQDDDRRRTRDAGFDHHVLKPIDPARWSRCSRAANESFEVAPQARVVMRAMQGAGVR